MIISLPVLRLIKVPVQYKLAFTVKVSSIGEKIDLNFELKWLIQLKCDLNLLPILKSVVYVAVTYAINGQLYVTTEEPPTILVFM